MTAGAKRRFSDAQRESRARERREFDEPLDVTVAKSGVFIGRLQNLTTSGMRLDSEVLIPAGRLIRARIETPASPDSHQYIDIQVQCRWCHPDVRGRRFLAGFRFVNTTFRQKLLLQTLIGGEAPEFAELSD